MCIYLIICSSRLKLVLICRWLHTGGVATSARQLKRCSPNTWPRAGSVRTTTTWRSGPSTARSPPNTRLASPSSTTCSRSSPNLFSRVSLLHSLFECPIFRRSKEIRWFLMNVTYMFSVPKIYRLVILILLIEHNPKHGFNSAPR